MVRIEGEPQPNLPPAAPRDRALGRRAPDGPLGPRYAGKLVEAHRGAWYFMAFRGDGDRRFTGELTDPPPCDTTTTAGSWSTVAEDPVEA
jgi:hypothetical protein